MGDADIEARSDHLIAGLETRVAARFDDAGKIDAADAGKAPDDPARTGSRQRILVIDAGVGNANRHLAGIEHRLVNADQTALCFTFNLFNQERLEGTHEFSLMNANGDDTHKIPVDGQALHFRRQTIIISMLQEQTRSNSIKKRQ